MSKSKTTIIYILDVEPWRLGTLHNDIVSFIEEDKNRR